MKVGDLVRSTYTGEIFIITEQGTGRYYIVSNRWQMPEEHLEVISESR